MSIFYSEQESGMKKDLGKKFKESSAVKNMAKIVARNTARLSGEAWETGTSIANTLGKRTKVSKGAVKLIQSNINKPVQQELSHGQQMLREMFSGERLFCSGNNLPNLNDRSINAGTGETLRCFGVSDNSTGSMFGVRRR